MTKVKIFTAMMSDTLEKRVNNFLALENIEVLKVEFRMSFWECGAMILYKEK